MSKDKIKVNGQVIELTDMCHWNVRNGVLWNMNTLREEGVEGDIVEYKHGDTRYCGHVVGYTCYQFVTTEEWGSVILSTTDPRPTFTHISKVEMIKGDE